MIKKLESNNHIIFRLASKERPRSVGRGPTPAQSIKKQTNPNLLHNLNGDEHAWVEFLYHP